MARNGRPARTKREKERDYARIARLYVQGWTHERIGKHLGLSRGQIYVDLKTVRQRWLDQQLHGFNERKAQELTKIDRIERLANEAWESSRKSVRKVVVETDADGNVVRRRVMKMRREGSAVWLEKIQWCIDKRCQIWGLDAPKKFAHVHAQTSGALGRPLGELSDDELLELVLRSGGTGGAGQVIEAQSSETPALEFQPVHDAGLSGDVVSPEAVPLCGPMGGEEDSQADDFRSAENGQTGERPEPDSSG